MPVCSSGPIGLATSSSLDILNSLGTTTSSLAYPELGFTMS